MNEIKKFTSNYVEDLEKKKKNENNLLKLNSNKSYRLLGWKIY